MTSFLEMRRREFERTERLHNALFYGVSAIIAVAVVTYFVGRATGGVGTYSSGVRAGVVSKVTVKGLFWKSYEATVMLGGYGAGVKGGVVPSEWNVSTLDVRIADALEDAMANGKPVRVKYRQWLLSPWAQKTDYTALEVSTTPPGEE